MKLSVILSAFLIMTSAFAMPMKYKIDTTKGKVGFEIYKFKISSPVFGKFNKYSGNFEFDTKAKTISNIDVVIVADSVDTAEAKRDKHLRSADFFDVEKYKTLTFKSNSVVNVVNGKAKVPGTLTMRGKTKKVILEIEQKNGKSSAPHFVAKTVIDRNHFGISWNKTFSLADISKNVLGDEVRIELDIYTQK